MIRKKQFIALTFVLSACATMKPEAPVTYRPQATEHEHQCVDGATYEYQACMDGARVVTPMRALFVGLSYGLITEGTGDAIDACRGQWASTRDRCSGIGMANAN